MKISIIAIKAKKIDDFSKERNLALKKADGNWVFFLDSDEVMSSKLKTEIENLKEQKEINGYYIKRMGTVEERLLRLAKKDSGNWERCVHEVWRVRGKIGKLKYPIIHNDRITIAKSLEKTNFYSDLHAKANKKEGKKATLFKIIFFPIVKFIQTYIYKKAYKKGTWGLVFSLIQSFQSFLSWTKLYFLSI